MRNLKKILALVLAFMMVLSMMAVASAADFVDADEIEHTEAVNVMAGLGILVGTPTTDGEFKFNPNGILNRAEAAKIIAYIMTGDADYVVAMAKYMDHPFADAKGHWSEPYVAYCYNEGFVTGLNKVTYGVKADLTGFAFAKLLLCAAGINTNEHYVAADSWTLEVYKDLKNHKLLTGLSDVDFDAAISRQDAAQLAWNVMNWSPAGQSIEYIVWVDTNGDDVVDAGESVVYEGTEALIATLIKNETVNGELKRVVKTVGSLADTVFGVSVDENADDFGRVTKVYTSTLLPTMKVTLADDNAAHTYVATANATVGTAAQLLTAVNNELDLDEALTQTSATMILNGTENFADIKIGDTVEVYAADGVVSKVIVIRETLESAARAASAETSGVNKGLYKWTFGTAVTYAAKDAYTVGNYYTVISKEAGAEDTALNVTVPTVIAGAKIARADNQVLESASYVIVNGKKLVLSGIYADSITTLAYNTPYDYILNSNGYLLSITLPGEAPVEETPETGFAYLQAAEKQITATSVGNSLIGGAGSYSWDIVAKAQLAMPNGTSVVVDLNTEIITSPVTGQVTSAKVNGVTLGDVLNDTVADNLMDTTDESMFNGFGWVMYTVEKDGTYTLTNVSDLNNYGSLTLDKTVSSGVVDGKFVTSDTVWNLYKYNEDEKVASVTTVTGYTKFTNGTYASSTYTTSLTNDAIITGINSFQEPHNNPAPTATYAYYAGQGEYDGIAQSYSHKFYIDGKVVEYFTANTVSTGDTDENNVLKAGNVYTLTFDAAGKVSAADYKAYGEYSGKAINLIDARYILLENGATDAIVYFGSNAVAYNVSEGHNGEADTLSTKVTAGGNGDTIKYIADNDGKLLVAYIVTEAN